MVATSMAEFHLLRNCSPQIRWWHRLRHPCHNSAWHPSDPLGSQHPRPETPRHCPEFLLGSGVWIEKLSEPMKNTIWQILYIKSCIIKYVYAYNASHRFGRKHTSQIFLLNFVFFNPTSGCWMPKLQAEPRNCNVRGRLCWKSGF